MIEIITRRFKLEEGEDKLTFISFIQEMDGYQGNMKVKEPEITADFYRKVI